MGADHGVGGRIIIPGTSASLVQKTCRGSGSPIVENVQDFKLISFQLCYVIG
jgi:hypothetical protein